MGLQGRIQNKMRVQIQNSPTKPTLFANMARSIIHVQGYETDQK